MLTLYRVFVTVLTDCPCKLSVFPKLFCFSEKVVNCTELSQYTRCLRTFTDFTNPHLANLRTREVDGTAIFSRRGGLKALIKQAQCTQERLPRVFIEKLICSIILRSVPTAPLGTKAWNRASVNTRTIPQQQRWRKYLCILLALRTLLMHLYRLRPHLDVEKHQEPRNLHKIPSLLAKRSFVSLCYGLLQIECILTTVRKKVFQV